MPVACLFDIHGNLPALEAVLDEVSQSEADHVVVGGDVLPGPFPAECLDRLFALDLPVEFIIGNGDRETLTAMREGVSSAVPPYFHDAMRWNASQLTDEHAKRIAQWPLTLRLHVGGIGDVLFCHATPRNDSEIILRTTTDATLLSMFEPLGVHAVVCGHTHMQHQRTVGTTRIINAGSIGASFQGPGAYWALMGPTVQLRRTYYDVEKAAARVRATAYPQKEEFASTSILQPPTEEATLKLFAAAALK
ncbi:MAG TPA: metallophosphoesterase family protein [Vicinamibacterales bacterium]